MKRFSAPPSLYPSPVGQLPSNTISSSNAATDPTTSDSSNGLGPQPACSQPHPQQDPSGKRVKTEQTFEALLDAETQSDVVVNVNSDQFVFHAHRVILEMKSDVLAQLLAGLAENQGGGEPGVAGGRCVPVLRVTEVPECSQVFSRFMYFLYSGAVWLHQDYVLPLFRLAHKYNVRSLLAHCEAYILQVLAKSCTSPPVFPASAADPHPANFQGQNHHHPHNNQHHQLPYNRHHQHHHHSHHHHSLHHNHSLATAAISNLGCPPHAGSGFSLDVVCDLYEDEVFAGDVRQTCFRVLCCQFRQLVRLPRWAKCRVQTACELLASDLCQVEENLVLAAATDYMKQNNLSDKKQIESILANIRYPCLNRHLLYQLHRNGSFKNFPGIQDLMLDAVRYHCFKDLPEAKGDFVGVQFSPRIGTSVAPVRRASVQVAATAVTTAPVAGDSYLDPVSFPDSGYSIESDVPVVLTRSRQSQV